ncbi:MAG: MFS transporter [Oscillospiraceae bacterium]|nr:MFS transporter [Oscillospiraceae bacterium]
MEKKHIRPAASAFLLMVTMSLLSTALSFFVTPVCEELGFGRGSFTLYYSLMTAAGAFSVSFLGRYMNDHGVRMVVLVSALWCGVGFIALSFCRELWMFYIVGALMGLFGTSCVYLCANITVQQSYSSRDASMVMGIVMAGSGIGGMIWSNVVPGVIDAFGWQLAYRALGVSWFALAMLSFLILGKQELSGGVGHASGNLGKTDGKTLFRSRKFFLSVGVMCILTACSCISQQLPSLLAGMGYDGTTVGLMISVMTAAAAVGTVVEGLCCGKFGVAKTMTVVAVFYALGYGMLFFKSMTYVALVGLAFGSGSLGTLMPVVVRHVFGGRDYATVWSTMLTCSSVTSFLATPVWGMVYDVFGNYTPAMITMPILLVISVFLLLTLFREKQA